ncbi:unnamed protein product (macronuclear) [Paramecium tetraurelia]|uniref:Uncharacterized protein n=1 Tax=Paramecium tetraurelia TaxID=5888 RepID=A0CWS2_PARTE|nr:uncharacterized protein GSPATT00001442001 [Paramecium tetraurelia]CAK75239.1 unnamed protein product [Paramecium tetraurelia]|eukprot:XP_001442636.1 hypothetical protein (macronuclear) [Paramecium tetraurelia strain d4-2]
MSLIQFKREKYGIKLRRDALEKIFSLKRVINSPDIVQVFQKQLESYETDILEAIEILKQYQNIKPEYVQLWLFLLYDCFIYLDQQYKGNEILDLLLFSVIQYPQGIIQFIEYQLFEILLRYQDIQALQIIETILKSQIIRSRDVQIEPLVNYICSYIPELTNNILNILILLSHNIECKAVIIANDPIMNMLLMENNQFQDERSRILSHLSRGNVKMVYYFYNSKDKLQSLFYLNTKHCLKIIMRLICYDETKKILSIMREQRINIQIEKISSQNYITYKNEIEDILQEFQQ